MTFVALQYDNETGTAKIKLDDDGRVAMDGGLETICYMLLFSYGRSDNQYGWWGHDQYGSLIWTLAREPTSMETLQKLKNYAIRALQPLVANGLAKSIAADAEFQESKLVALRVKVLQPDGKPWTNVWSVHLNAL